MSIKELGRNAAQAMMRWDAIPLCRLGSAGIAEAGVYTLHYNGDFPEYANLPSGTPIYVGKAEPPGKRQGRSRKSEAIAQRLRNHVRSIESAQNLDLKHFSFRWLVLDSVWIGLTEQILISTHKPLWNVVVDGFGNNDPGKGRSKQQRSAWDTLHPGRHWAGNLQPHQKTVENIKNDIKNLGCEK